MHRRQSPLFVSAAALFVVFSSTGCLGPGTLNEGECNATGREIIQKNCLSCHSASLAAGARAGAPTGVNFDTEADLQRWAASIRDTTIVRKTMPPGAPLPDCELATLDAYLTQLESLTCLPSCSGRVCGDDGCGGSCGVCAQGKTCDATYGQCVAQNCTPDCTGAQCGSDGCGGSCGSCGTGLTCSPSRTCVCQPDCSGKQCGSDGCGGSCGTCQGGLFCKTSGNTSVCSATCTPDCTGKACGDDGCGGSCGTCPSLQACGATGQCVCAPQCSGKTCGDDGCGGTCGTCSGLSTCVNDQCTYPTKSYAADVHPLFQPSCSSAGCHNGSVAVPLDFRTATAGYDGLVDKSSSAALCTSKILVKPGDIANSYLMNKLTGIGMCFGSSMPKGAAPLTSAQLDIIRAWIGSGAKP